MSTYYHYQSVNTIIIYMYMYMYFIFRTLSNDRIRVGPVVIKLFESENELKCKNHLHDFL